jgi:hypothetical protein
LSFQYFRVFPSQCLSLRKLTTTCFVQYVLFFSQYLSLLITAPYVVGLFSPLLFTPVVSYVVHTALFQAHFSKFPQAVHTALQAGVAGVEVPLTAAAAAVSRAELPALLQKLALFGDIPADVALLPTKTVNHSTVVDLSELPRRVEAYFASFSEQRRSNL